MTFEFLSLSQESDEPKITPDLVPSPVSTNNTPLANGIYVNYYYNLID